MPSRVIKSPEWLSKNDDQRSEKAARILFWREFSNDRWLVSACYEPWAHLLDLDWIFGGTPLNQGEVVLQRATKKWLHARVYLGMALAYEILDRRLPDTHDEPLTINFETEISRPWKGLAVDDVLKKILAEFKPQDISVKQHASKKPIKSKARHDVAIRYDTYSINESFGPAPCPITESVQRGRFTLSGLELAKVTSDGQILLWDGKTSKHEPIASFEAN